MTALRFGMVGTGMIAEVLAKAIQAVETAELSAVSSRLAENAEKFAKEHNIPNHFATWQEMVNSDLIDAVYVAVPSYAKDDIAQAAAATKKHLLVDKPFLSLPSVQAMVDACQTNNLAFMDGTHFVHHPRTHHLKAKMMDEIGTPQAIHSNFFFPFMETSNIRFQPGKEPKTAVGDMAWYCMRAIVEYMPQATDVIQVSGYGQRLQETNSIIRGAAFMQFNDNCTTTCNFGYNAGVCLMDLDILGQTGSYNVDDFVLDWQSGFPFDRPNHTVGYTIKKEMLMPTECEHIKIPNPKPQTEHMIERFVEFAANPGGKDAQNSIAATLKTQKFLDALWEALK